MLHLSLFFLLCILDLLDSYYRPRPRKILGVAQRKRNAAEEETAGGGAGQAHQDRHRLHGQVQTQEMQVGDKMISFPSRLMHDGYHVEAVGSDGLYENTDGGSAEHATIIVIGKSYSGKNARKAALWCGWESSVSRSLQVISKSGSVVFNSHFTKCGSIFNYDQKFS